MGLRRVVSPLSELMLRLEVLMFDKVEADEGAMNWHRRLHC